MRLSALRSPRFAGSNEKRALPAPEDSNGRVAEHWLRGLFSMKSQMGVRGARVTVAMRT